MSFSLKETALSFFGLNPKGPFLQRDDFKALAQVAEPAIPELEMAMKNIELKRVLATLLNFVGEVSAIAFINLIASGDTELQKNYVIPLALLAFVPPVVRQQLSNARFRLNDIAVQRTFTHLHTSDESLKYSDKRHMLGPWQSQVSSMASAELQFGNQPENKLFWLSAQLLNLALLFPELSPVILGQWVLSVFQIAGNTRVFKDLQTKFQSVVQKNNIALKLHGRVTDAERVEEQSALKRVVAITTVINAITTSTIVPFIWAVATGASLAAKVSSSLLPVLNIVSSQVSNALGTAIGAHLMFTSALIGRSKLADIIDQIKQAKVMSQNLVDRELHRERLSGELSIDEVFAKRGIAVPDNQKALLFAQVNVPRPKDNEMLIQDLTGYILLSEGKITVISGGSGKGKSLLAETILQRYLKATGRTGVLNRNGKIEDIRDGSITGNEYGTYLNEDDMPGDMYWADLALPYNLQVALIATEGFDFQDKSIIEFLRMSWGEKQKNKNNSHLLSKVFASIETHLKNTLIKTGLFQNGSGDIGYYLSQEIGVYSDGEKQRLFLASLYLIPKLPIVILDEPFRALDSNNKQSGDQSSKQAMAAYLLLLEEKGTNVIIISHEEDRTLDTLLGQENIGCRLHLTNGQLLPMKGSEHMASLTSVPLSGTDTAEEVMKPSGDKVKNAVPLDARQINQLIVLIEELYTQVDYDSNSGSFDEEPYDQAKFSQTVKSIIESFSKIISSLQPGQTIDVGNLEIDWRFLDQSIGFFLVRTANENNDFVPIAQILERFYYLIDENSGETASLKRFLYKSTTHTIQIYGGRFDVQYLQQIEKQQDELGITSFRRQEEAQILHAEDVPLLKGIIDAEKNMHGVSAALVKDRWAVTEPVNMSEEESVRTILEALRETANLLETDDGQQVVYIHTDTCAVEDWKVINDLANRLFDYLLSKIEDEECSSTQYAEAIELFSILFRTVHPDISDRFVDWMGDSISGQRRTVSDVFRIIIEQEQQLLTKVLDDSAHS